MSFEKEIFQLSASTKVLLEKYDMLMDAQNEEEALLVLSELRDLQDNRLSVIKQSIAELDTKLKNLN